MKTKKILIILSDYLFIRNYIKTNVFKNLINKKKYDIEFLINSSLKINELDFKGVKYTKFYYPNSTKFFTNFSKKNLAKCCFIKFI